MTDAPKVTTEKVRVRMFVRNGASIEGLAHIKPGAYQKRISDILNLGQVKFIPVTDVVYSMAGTAPISTDCVLVSVDDVVMVDVTPPRPGDEAFAEPELPGASS